MLCVGVEWPEQCTDLYTSAPTQTIAADLLADTVWLDAHASHPSEVLHEAVRRLARCAS